eukprot:Sspe_Gene.22930::Locus_8817_Transcript_1_1_Confidence_1.000_Length_1687::g.22930::m.22930
MAALWWLLLVLGAVGTTAERPHILFILVDDYGWDNVGYHHSTPDREVVTPNTDALAKEGLILDRHYVFRFCSPSRSSLQTGRLPVHVNVRNADPTVYNPKDVVGGYAGIPVNMTGIAQKLAAAGYRTHMTGKWDAGMATPAHTPIGRGYQTWFGYYHHANDYWSEKLPLSATGTTDICGNKYIDLWDTHAPAVGKNGTVYEEVLFTNRTLSVIANHNLSQPLFLFHSFHLIHTPLQVPEEYLQEFAFIDNAYERRPYAAMVKYMDDSLGKIIAAVKAREGMWENTLIVFSSDNGGPIYYPGGANNYPLKGGKMSDWEGGIRVNAFVSGGYLPAKQRGKTYEGLVHIADWYTTFCHLAGADPEDHAAAAAGLPPVDGINQWEVLSGASNATVRDEIHISDQCLIKGRYKLIVGEMTQTGWTGPQYPNNTGLQPTYPALVPIGSWKYNCNDGCLFDIFADPTEHNDLAPEQLLLVRKLRARLDELNGGNYDPDRGTSNSTACAVAENKYGGFYGPFIGI